MMAYIIQVFSEEGNYLGYILCSDMKTVQDLTEHGYGFPFPPKPEDNQDGRTTGLICGQAILSEKTQVLNIPADPVNGNNAMVVRKIYVSQYVLVHDKTPPETFDYNFCYELRTS